MDQLEFDAIPLCSINDVPEGEMRCFRPDGLKPIAIYNVEGAFYATDDFCTHGQASLSKEGLLEGHVIECGWHLGAFDIRNGEPVAPPCQIALRTYQVLIDGDRVYVKLERGKRSQ